MHVLRLDEDGFYRRKSFPDNNIPPYAILSHTWGSKDDEASFNDIHDTTHKKEIFFQGLFKNGYDKIRFCGEQAKRDGLHYFWVDSCCIDSANEVELRKAINYMFRWYKNAKRCYVYLSDVSAQDQGGQPLEWTTKFRESRWFTRGWTLQELLAPRIVEFYSKDCIRLGDKRSLEHEIREVTGIPITALQGRDLRDFDAEERLQWADARQTTQEEDMAYCLLGIFDISMTTRYGEGYDKTMRRLLNNIVKSFQAGLQSSGESIVL